MHAHRPPAFALAAPLLALALVLAPCLATPAEGKQIYFSGNTSYNYTGNSLTLRANKVVSDRPGGQSGTLKFILWATKNKYQGGNITGYELGSFTRNPLKGGFHYKDIAQTVTMTQPPAGSYWMTLTVSEYNNGVYRILDFVTYPKKESFGGGVKAPAPVAGRIHFNGNTSYSYNGNALTLKANQLINTRAGGQSGTLKYILWATKKKYQGGNISGYELGSFTQAPLKGGYNYKNIAQTVTMKRPPSGSYWMTLTVSEYNNGVYRILDHVTYPRKETF